MSDLEQFAEEAARFETWANGEIGSNEKGVWIALRRITALYLLALDLGPPQYGSGFLSSDIGRVDDAEWKSIASNVSTLPVDQYSVVFNPLIFPPEKPVVGSLADDIPDIYRDVVFGLRAYRAGERDRARWEWAFKFEVHWGRHASRAIAALHQSLMDLAAKKFVADK